MALTFGTDPLGRRPGPANYTIDGPQHRILLTPVAKRLRVVVGDGAGGEETLLDTTEAVLLHETGLLPRYYVPLTDVREELLAASDTTTHCPFKGDASYYSVQVGDRTAADLLWTYQEPNSALPDLKGKVGLYLERLDEAAGDAVYEEAQRLLGHPRDPYHRVDAWPSNRHVQVLWQRPGQDEPVVLADTTAPVGVFETSLPPVWYIPVADVRSELLTGSDTTSVCPYKGVASYRSLVDGPSDVAWGYEEPLGEALALPGHLAFAGEGISVSVTIEG